ncbi:hypothetical protein Tco_0056874 [Tanacetum coccineum]
MGRTHPVGLETDPTHPCGSSLSNPTRPMVGWIEVVMMLVRCGSGGKDGGGDKEMGCGGGEDGDMVLMIDSVVWDGDAGGWSGGPRLAGFLAGHEWGRRIVIER